MGKGIGNDIKISDNLTINFQMFKTILPLKEQQQQQQQWQR